MIKEKDWNDKDGCKNVKCAININSLSEIKKAFTDREWPMRKEKDWYADSFANMEKVEKDPTGRGSKDDGSKLDFGKPDCSLLGYFGNALLAVAEVGTYGAIKYTRGGWQHVPDGINRYTAAMLRHYLKENESELDDDLPVLHAAQVAWNALARLELMLREKK